MKSRSLRIASLLIAAAPISLSAMTTQSFVDDLVTDFASGDYTTSTLTQKGFVRPAVVREKLTSIDADVVWDLTEINGVRYAVTGHEGKVFRQQGTAPATELTKFKEPALYATAPLKNGQLAVAASPGGTVYTVDDKGTTGTLALTGATLVWDLLPVPGGLIAATGAPASLIRIDDRGTTTSLAKLEKPANILDVAEIPGSTDLAIATQGPGLIGRVSPDGKVRILIDPEQDEVRRVAVGPDGSIYGAVNGVRSPGDKLLGVVPVTAPPPTAGNKPRPESFIVRAWPNGFVEEIWAAPESPIHDFALLADGDMLVAAGSKGAMISVTAAGDTERLGIADQQLITRLVAVGDGFLAGTGTRAAIYTIKPGAAAPGIFDSQVFDAKGPALWARLRGIADAGKGAISIAWRTGNIKTPDNSWSDWSEPVDFANGDAPLTAATGRFFQYRLRLIPPAKVGDAVPAVDLVRVLYGIPNTAPRLTNVKTEPQKPKDPAGAAASRGKVDITWDAIDANKDSLLFNVLLHSLGGGDPQLVAEDLSAPRHTLDSLAIPDGRYRIEVVASDVIANGGDRGGTASDTSAVFLIDNNAPVVTIRKQERKGDSVTIAFDARDTASLVTRAEWRTGLDLARPVLPSDSFYDSQTESFTLTVTGAAAKPGNVIILTVADENDNRSNAEVIIR